MENIKLKSMLVAHRFLRKPFLVGIAKATLDKSLGLPQYKRDFKNKVHAKRPFMYKQIIPEQNSSNPNFKHYFYYIRLTTFSSILIISKQLPEYLVYTKPMYTLLSFN